MATKRWRLLWSEKASTLTDVVANLGTPVLVKVDGSIYEINDERFKPGDLLQIHSKRTVKKVVGSVIVDDSSGTRSQRRSEINLTDDISISIGNKRTLTIKRRDAGHKVYQSVMQLAQECPKYVRLIDDTTDKRGYTIKAKSDFEIIGKEKGGGLSGLCDGYNYILSPYQPLKCLLLSDDTDYTIQELVDRFPLPQTVSFSKAESPNLGINPFTGMKDISLDGKCIRIKNYILQEIFICTLNPPIKSPTSKDKYTSTMVAIPVDSVTATQLQVKIPQEPKANNYGVVMSKTVPKTDDIISAIDETIDTVNYPNVLFVPRKEIPKPLPQRAKKRVPPTTPQGRPQNNKEQTKDDDDDDDDDDYEPVGPQVLPPGHGTRTQETKLSLPTKKTSRNPPPGKDELNEPTLYAGRPTGIAYEDEDEHLYDVISERERTLRDRRPKSDSDSIESLVSKVPKIVREGLIKVHNELVNFKWKRNRSASMMETKTGPTNPDNNPDKSRSFPYRSDVGTKTYDKPAVPGPGTASHNDPSEQRNTSMFIQKLKALAMTKKTSKKENFFALNTTDLIAYLERCGLNNMADMVKKENLDGKFFEGLDDEIIKSTFGLDNIQLIKFRKMRDLGWEPNVN